MPKHLPDGRPTKLTQRFKEVLGSILKDGTKALLTDETLLFLVNQELSKEEQVSNGTFERWKSAGTKDSRGQEFRVLIKKALTLEQTNLLNEIRKGKNNWQSRAWILERKFDEWNLRHKSEMKAGVILTPSPERQEAINKLLEKE